MAGKDEEREASPKTFKEHREREARSDLEALNHYAELAIEHYGPTLEPGAIASILRGRLPDGRTPDTPIWPHSWLVVYHPSFAKHLRWLRDTVLHPVFPLAPERRTHALDQLAEIADALAIRPQKRGGRPKKPLYEKEDEYWRKEFRNQYAELLEKTVRLIEEDEPMDLDSVPAGTDMDTAVNTFQGILEDLREQFETLSLPYRPAFLNLPLEFIRTEISRGLALLWTSRKPGPRRFQEIAKLWEQNWKKPLPKRPKRSPPR